MSGIMPIGQNIGGRSKGQVEKPGRIFGPVGSLGGERVAIWNKTKFYVVEGLGDGLGERAEKER